MNYGETYNEGEQSLLNNEGLLKR